MDIMGDRFTPVGPPKPKDRTKTKRTSAQFLWFVGIAIVSAGTVITVAYTCLLYTSDAADE